MENVCLQPTMFLKYSSMNKIVFLLLVFFIVLSASSQNNPVEWEYKVILSKDKYSLNFIADIKPEWHLYAAHLPYPDEGPYPTEFHYDDSEYFKLLGSVSESNPIKSFDAIFEIDVSFFERSAEFIQPIKIISLNEFNITGNISYMVCNEKMCIPYEVPFKINFIP